MMKMVYEVAFNTGDMYWDNLPEYEKCDSLEELKEVLGERLTEEKLEELENDHYTCDDDCVVWEARKLEEDD